MVRRSYSYIVVLAVVTSGCAKQAGESPLTDSVTAASFNSSGAPTVEFSVPDMMCVDGCAVAVKEILAKQPGAKDVFVDFDAKTATVAIEESQFDAQRALAALVDKRFDNSSLQSTTPHLPPPQNGATESSAEPPATAETAGY